MADTLDLIEQTLELFQDVETFDWYEFHDTLQASLIEMFIEKHENKSAAARALGMNRTTIVMRQKK